MSSSALTALRLLTVISGSSGAVFAALGYMDFVAIEKIVNFGVSQRTTMHHTTTTTSLS
ncbi:MAG: hypothetical protein ACI306_04815 [Muribaculaceae bacterium]